MGSEKAVIFPGYPESCHDSPYSEVVEIYSGNGFDAHPARINWSTDLTENLEQAEKILSEYKDSKLHVFGHSWGAVCALWASRNKETESLLLASMSPEFKEDREQFGYLRRKMVVLVENLSRYIGKTGFQPEQPSLEEVQDIDVGEIFLLYGQREFRGYLGVQALGFGKQVSANRLDILPNSSEKVVEDAGHEINQNYLNVISEIVRSI